MKILKRGLKIGIYTTYKGDSTLFRTIGQNLVDMSKKYPYAQGYFGKSNEYTSNSNRSIISTNNIEEAYDFYDELTFGGIEREIVGNVKMTYMRDGTVITIRKSSTPDKMPVADISITYTLSRRSINMQKIRFIQGDFHEKDRL